MGQDDLFLCFLEFLECVSLSDCECNTSRCHWFYWRLKMVWNYRLLSFSTDAKFQREVHLLFIFRKINFKMHTEELGLCIFDQGQPWWISSGRTIHTFPKAVMVAVKIALGWGNEWTEGVKITDWIVQK